MVSLSNHEFRARWAVRGALLGLALALLAAPAMAASVANPVATFSGLDKITGRITNFDVYIGETVQFGALQITPRACYTRPPTETQRTTVFVEVDQVSLQQTVKRIFTGWMFADSPALNAIDHAVYDIWLIDCKQTSEVPPPDNVAAPVTQQAQTPPAATAPAPPPADATATGAIPPPPDDTSSPDAADQTDTTDSPDATDPAPIPDQPADTPSFITLTPPGTPANAPGAQTNALPDTP